MALTYAAGTDTATWSFPGFGGGSLSDGNFRAFIPKESVTNAGGTPLEADVDLEFFRYFGDDDGDRAVGFADLFAFNATFNLPLGDPAYDDAFDIDYDPATGAGAPGVGFAELFAFSANFDTVLAGPSGGSPMLAASLPPSLDAGAAGLDEGFLDAVVAEAGLRWKEVLGEEAGEPLDRVSFVVTDLPGLELAASEGLTVFLDATAAGHGWFVDPTPADDSEFEERDPGAWQAPAMSPAASAIDLLTVVTHELGHVLGLEHGEATSPAMAPRLETGLRLEAALAPEAGAPPEGSAAAPAPSEAQRSKAPSVSRSARVGAGVVLGDGARVLGRAEIGDHAVVGPGSLIGKDARIGARARIGADVRVERGAQVPEGAVVLAGTVVERPDGETRSGAFGVKARIESFLGPGSRSRWLH